MAKAYAFTLVLVVGCGRIGYETIAAPSAEGDHGDGLTDAGADEPRSSDGGIDTFPKNVDAADTFVSSIDAVDTYASDTKITMDLGLADSGVVDSNVSDTSGAAQDSTNTYFDTALVADGSSSTTTNDGSIGTVDNTVSCNSPQTLVDNFDDGVYGSAWIAPYTYSGASAQESAGVLTLTPANTEAYLRSELVYNVGQDTSVSVEVPKALDLVSNATTCLAFMGDDSSRQLTLCQVESGLRAQYHDPSAGITTLATIPYVAANHRFWRIQSLSGTIFWQYSSNGTAWSNLAQTSVPFGLDHLHIQLSASCWTSGSAGSASFDNLNAPETGGAALGSGIAIGCPMTLLVDDFEDSKLLPLWAISQGTTPTESSGTMNLPAPVSSTGTAAVMTDERYDLDGSSLSVKIAEMVDTSTTASAEFVLSAINGQDFLFFRQSKGTLRVLYSINYTETSVGSLPYDPVNHAYWRISESSGVVTWSTSADGIAWSVIGSASPAIDVRAMKASFKSSIWESVAAPGTFRIDSIKGENL